MFGPQAFFMNKQLNINKGFFTSLLSAFSDLDASINKQIELRNKERQLLPLLYFTCLILLLSQLIEAGKRAAPWTPCFSFGRNGNFTNLAR